MILHIGKTRVNIYNTRHKISELYVTKSNKHFYKLYFLPSIRMEQEIPSSGIPYQRFYVGFLYWEITWRRH